MSANNRNRLKTTISAVASSGLGAFTISTASSGYRSFVAGDDGLTFDGVLITEGTTWEVRDGCVYTHSGTSLSRGTLMDSSTGSAIAFTSAAVVSQGGTADFARRSESAGLRTVISSADANLTMQVGVLHCVDISGFTADRTATLPAVAAVDDRVGLYISTGDDAYEMLITAASGDTLAGIAGGTEWSRVFVTGEIVVLRCIVANTTWIVEEDGRIPQKCDMELTTSCDGEGVNTFTRPTQCPTAGVWTARVDVGSIASVSQDRITVRRAGNYNVLIAGRIKDSSADGANFNVACYQNAGATLVLLGGQQPGAAAQPIASSSRLLPLAADDYLVYQYRTAAGSLGQQSGQTWFDVLEIL